MNKTAINPDILDELTNIVSLNKPIAAMQNDITDIKRPDISRSKLVIQENKANNMGKSGSCFCVKASMKAPLR